MDATTPSEDLLVLLKRARDAAARVVREVGSISDLAGEELVKASEMAAEVARFSDVAMVATVDAVEEQCRRAGPGESVAARYGFRDAAALLMATTGASRRTLTRWRQVAACTGQRGVGSTGLLPPLLPQLAEAFGIGAVSVDQALVIRRYLLDAGVRAHPEDLEAAERSLVGAAAGRPLDEEDGSAGVPLSPELLGVQARAWRDAIDPDGPEPRFDEQQRQRSFTLSPRADGMWVGRLLLPPAQGEALRLALDAHNAPRTPMRYDEAEPGADGEASPDAKHVDGEAAARGSGLRRQGRVDDRSAAQRQADTLVGLISRAMERADAPRIGGEAATLVVTISEAELAEHARTGGGTARLERTREPVPAHVAARVLCDGYLQACVLDDDGLPLKLGRRRRSHTRHQRRAILTAYPGGCQSPGCDAPPGFTEIHHPVWWTQGGETDTDNGIPLCQHCHTEVHAGRLRCVQDAGGRWRVEPALRLRGRLSLVA